VTTTIPATTASAPPRAPHFALAVLALAVGGFAIGTTEFVTMGLLPQIADGVGVSIPTAGNVISAYALGVVVGAPVIAVFGAKLPRRALLVWLMVAYAAFNVLSAVATSYGVLFLARFLDGLPHGAYFGVASLALLTVVLIMVFVPSCPGNPAATGRRELLFFRNRQAMLTLLAGAVGFGGLFAVYSYIAPIVTEVGGLPESAIPLFTAAFGVGMVTGTWLAGRLADWSVFRSLICSGIGSGLVMLLVWWAAPHGWWLLPAIFLVTAIGSVLVINLQLRLMAVSGEAQTLGAAMNHASLNLANALGAWLGGVVIAAGYGYRAPALVGAVLSVAGIGVLLWSATLHRREISASAVSRS